MAWFTLNTSGNPTNPQNYTLETSGTPTCLGIDQICAVQADNDGNNKPKLTQELKDEMIIALHEREASVNVLLKDA